MFINNKLSNPASPAGRLSLDKKLVSNLTKHVHHRVRHPRIRGFLRGSLSVTYEKEKKKISQANTWELRVQTSAYESSDGERKKRK